jgi:hypothetical protein
LPLQISKTPIKVLVHHDGRGQHGDPHLGKSVRQIAEPASCCGRISILQLPTDLIYRIEQMIYTSPGPLSGQIDDGTHAADFQKPRRSFSALAVAGAVPNRPRKTLLT